MRYRITSTAYGNNVLKEYPDLDAFNLEKVEELRWNRRDEPPYTIYRHYIEINTIDEFKKLVDYVGLVIVQNDASHVEYKSPTDNGHYYCEPTIEIYDDYRE